MATNIVANLIAKTAAFEADIKRANKTLTDMARNVKSVQSIFKTGLQLGGMAYAVNTGLEVAKSMHEARRRGKDMTDAVMASIPGVSMLWKSLNECADEWTGMNVRVEEYNKFLERANSLGKIHNEILNQNALLSAPKGEQQSIQAAIAFQKQAADIEKQRLEINKSIAKLQKQASENKEDRPSIDGQINKLQKQKEQLDKDLALANKNRELNINAPKYEFFNDLKRQLAELQLSKIEITVQKARDVGIRDEGNLNSIRYVAQQIEKQEKLNDAREKSIAYFEALKKQLAELRLSESDLTIRRAKDNGITNEANLNAVRSLANQIKEQKRLNDEYEKERVFVNQIASDLETKAESFLDYKRQVQDLVSRNIFSKAEGEKVLEKRKREMLGDSVSNMRGESQAVNTKFVSFGGLLANSPNTMLKKLDDQIDELRKISTKLVDVKVAVENSGGGI